MVNSLNKTITRFLLEHGAKSPVSFHMPGHKGSAIYRENGYGEFLDRIMDCDITEIPGADNLFQAEDVILEVMEKYRKLYCSKETYLLINGSSAGIIAGILATVSKGGKLVMARNCHKSAFNALSLGDIEPVYAFPEIVDEYGILGEVTAKEIERCIIENPTAEAVILPSPNYYGILSDIEAIAEVTHRYGKTLIVDQAHGAHLKFFSAMEGYEEMRPAEELGADIVINSTHKTLASFTQTAILNVMTDRVNLAVLEDKLQVMESSSPSYPLMASLDINASLLLEKGEKLFGEWIENLEWFYHEADGIEGLSLMKVKGMDITKLNMDMSAYGVDGNQLEELLMEKGIFVELIAGNIAMGMTGIGNKRCDYEALIAALKEIASKNKLEKREKTEQPRALTRRLLRKAVPAERESVHIDEAEGRVCAMSIIPYPPGIPIACPGEVLDRETLDYIRARKRANEKVIGLSSDMHILVGK